MTGSSWPSSVGALRRPPAGVPMPDSGPVAGLPPSDVSHARALLVGLSAWAVSYGLVQVATPDTGVPGIWLPGAIVVGLMLRLRTGLWWWVLLGTALANVVGGLVAGFATALDTLIWTVANTVQMAAIAGVLRRWRIDLTRPHHVPVIAGVSAVVVAVVAFLGSLALEWSSGAVAQDLWREWWGSDVLALVLVVPAALAATRSGLPRGARAVEAVGWLVGVLVAMTLVYTDVTTTPFGGWFWITVSTPLVVFYARRFGFLAMTLFLTIVDSVAVAFTVNGTGPFIDPGVLGAGLPEVQAALGVLAVSVYTVSLMVFEGYRRARALAEQDDLLTAVFEGSPVASLVAVIDADGNGTIRRCNSAFAALVGRSANEMEGTAVDGWVAAEERAALRRLLRAARVRDGGAVQGEVVAVRPAGRILTRIGLATVGVTDGAPTRETWLVLHVEDVTEARRRERRLAEQATTDPLTGLANRRDLVQTLESRLSVVRPPAVVGVLFIDLDRFKNVNDRHGHDAGDRTLQAVARCMTRAVRPGDSLARFGGDEFVIVCPRLRGLDECEAVARRVQEEIRAVAAPYDHGGRIPVSIGAACSDDPDLDPEELIRQADRAMYLAKQRGGDRVVVSGQRVPRPSGRADDRVGAGEPPRPASGPAPVGW